jgi:inner membrane protein
MREQAVDFGERHARATDAPDARVTAIPRPVSPFNWTVVVDHGGRYEYANVNLVRRSVPPPPDAASGFIERLDAAYRPLGRAVWNEASIYGVPAEAALAREAYEQPGFRFFRWFATYPALLGVVRGNPQTCVWFEDLKFVTPGRRPTPFQYGMCREAEGRWEAYQLRGPERRRVY